MANEAVIQTRFVLASGSPRRRVLVHRFARPFEVDVPTGPEGGMEGSETPAELVSRLSIGKAKEVANRTDGAVVLAADTQVVLDGECLGKPSDKVAAARMLRFLRGRIHIVVTGVTLLDANSGRSRTSVKKTDVTMRHYSNAEIEAYVASGEPYDKAGGYAVQDTEFCPAVKVRGCYLNVVGLPLCDVVSLLESMGLCMRLNPNCEGAHECGCCRLGAEIGTATL